MKFRAVILQVRGFLWIEGHGDNRNKRAPRRFPEFPQGGSTAPTENRWAKSFSVTVNFCGGDNSLSCVGRA